MPFNKRNSFEGNNIYIAIDIFHRRECPENLAWLLLYSR